MRTQTEVIEYHRTAPAILRTRDLIGRIVLFRLLAAGSTYVILGVPHTSEYVIVWKKTIPGRIVVQWFVCYWFDGCNYGSFIAPRWLYVWSILCKTMLPVPGCTGGTQWMGRKCGETLTWHHIGRPSICLYINIVMIQATSTAIDGKLSEQLSLPYWDRLFNAFWLFNSRINEAIQIGACHKSQQPPPLVHSYAPANNY